MLEVYGSGCLAIFRKRHERLLSHARIRCIGHASADRRRTRSLNLMMIGERDAMDFGVEVGRVRLIVFGIASLLVGMAGSGKRIRRIRRTYSSASREARDRKRHPDGRAAVGDRRVRSLSCLPARSREQRSLLGASRRCDHGSDRAPMLLFICLRRS